MTQSSNQTGYPLRNNFDILRTALAYMVVISHARFLFGANATYFPFNLSGLGVDGFFVISGFLMAWSLERQPELKPYTVKRFFRIYPLYFVIVSLQAILFAALAIPGFPQIATETLQYYSCNLVFLNFLKPSIDGVLAGLSVNAINGSLWTLKVETAFYVVLPMLLFLYRALGRMALFCGYAFSSAYVILLPSAPWTEQLPGQLRFFIIGILLFFYGRRLSWNSTGLLALGLVGVIINFLMRAAGVPGAGLSTTILDPIFTGCLVYGIAFARFVWQADTDFSYSAYLLHFPLIQLALLYQVFSQSFWLFLAFILVSTTALAWLSFRFVEQPFIAVGRTLASRYAGGNR